MPTLGELFKVYWEDMDRCRKGGAFWSLLHVTVCLPDICAALETEKGETKNYSHSLYRAWCDKWLKNPMLSGDERYFMRCKVLHQGRASTDRPGRYTKFAFSQTIGSQPVGGGAPDHMLAAGGILHLDVGLLADETRDAVARWIDWIETHPRSTAARNARRHSTLLVQVQVSDATIYTPTFAVPQTKFTTS